MSDGNIIFTNFECFLGLLWPLSTDIKGAKGTDVKDDDIGSADV